MTREQELFQEENRILAALAAEPSLEGSLRPVLDTDFKPGLVLLYKLGDTYGCHILRSKADKYKYKNGLGLRLAVNDGRFVTFNDDVEL